jgi:hypothetical protein
LGKAPRAVSLVSRARGWAGGLGVYYINSRLVASWWRALRGCAVSQFQLLQLFFVSVIPRARARRKSNDLAFLVF